MKILVSGAFPPDTAVTTWHNPLFDGVVNAFSAMGHEAFAFDAAAFLDNPTPHQKWAERCLTLPMRMMGLPKRVVKHWLPWSATYQQERALLTAVRQHQPDMLLVMAYVRYRPSVLQACKAMGVKHLVGWCLEGPLHEFKPWHECMHYDRYFCIHHHVPGEYANRIQWLPALCLDSQNFHRIAGVSATNKVVFVGARTERRAHFLRALSHLPLEIWGPGGWPKEPTLAHAFQGEFIWGEALNRLYNESAIVLNISSWDPALSGLPQRVVDIPAAGACLLTDSSDDLQHLFNVGQDIATFKSPAQLAALCQHYLDHAEERKTLAQAGWCKAQAMPNIHQIAQQLISAVS